MIESFIPKEFYAIQVYFDKIVTKLTGFEAHCMSCDFLHHLFPIFRSLCTSIKKFQLPTCIMLTLDILTFRSGTFGLPLAANCYPAADNG